MGYYTRYELTAEPVTALLEVVDSFTDDLRYALGRDGESGDSCKWYDHEEDMRLFSQQFPEVTFKLHGEGEETGDIWDKYFRNGKMQVCKAKIVIPPMREDSWR